MGLTLNNDILLLIVSILATESASITPQHPKAYNPLTDKWYIVDKAKDGLLALRCTCQFLAISITPYFFSDIVIDRIDKRSWRRLRLVQKSAFIPDAVRTYTLQPAVVHTAPVVKSSPWDYYGDLVDASYHHEPPYSALVAEHGMRQRVKAHWDEQQHFMIPNYGSIAWLARTASNFVWRSTSIGSALNESVFLKVMSDFTNLRELVVGYEDSRKHAIIRTVHEDLSIGLGRYLASIGGARLETLKLHQVWPEDLRLLVSTMEDTTRSSSKSSGASMTTEPLNDSTPASPAASPPFQLHLSSLTVIFTKDADIFTTQSTAPPLGNLLKYTPDLKARTQPCIHSSSSSYRPPPLWELE
ncbi:MAG: hypothetical protein Q9178_006270 [Gyalolechia marmorata]